MQLLVSVRNAEEARAAVAGGASIIDAKDPGTGALGAVSRSVLREIQNAVPPENPVSAALGDVRTPVELDQVLGLLPEGLAFIKLGFHGISDASLVESLLADAVRRIAPRPNAPRVIAVAYADWRDTGGLTPEFFPGIITRAGAHGLLIDTALKNGRTLSVHLPADDLVALGKTLARLGLTYALGGSLTPSDIPLAQVAGADIIGVRGAVTTGSRTDPIDTERVAAFADALRRSGSPSLL
jgi:uncharacterized protein (UPF0264 family)